MTCMSERVSITSSNHSTMDVAGEDGTVSWQPREDSDDERDDLHVGFTLEEFNTCVKVLDHLNSHHEQFRLPLYKDLRATMRTLMADVKSHREAKSAATDEEKDAKARAKAKRLHQRQIDQKLLDTRQLRAQRLDALKKLRSQASQHSIEYHSVPDGPATSLAALEAAQGGPTQLKYRSRACYVCKGRFTELHPFYDMLCPKCAPLNWTKRHQTADLGGTIAIVTGGRIKIGFHISLKLLRAGASVVVVTRFPQDALTRFQQESDAGEWLDRLELYGLDLRNLAATEAFCAWFKAKHQRLDVIINNACQTIRRPPAFYRHLIEGELKGNETATPQICQSQEHAQTLSGLSHQLSVGSEVADKTPESPMVTVPASAVAALGTQIPMVLEDTMESSEHFPQGVTDVHQQQLDLRTKTSWVLKLGEISTPEAAEVMAVNTLSPFIINGKLRPVMAATESKAKYIVNVSAMEGKFYRFKSPNHPHTNMAKAALNMMTRTSAQDYATDDIYMTAVDTGWINDENPVGMASRYAKEHNFQTPIDEVDAAARVLDPVFVGVNEEVYLQGIFLKDYHETEW
eukprot:m.53174 g.53174  ORF g.53174 m.53174 type:complete len:573 (-) comp13538_c0_seq4:97-1815(-)